MALPNGESGMESPSVSKLEVSRSGRSEQEPHGEASVAPHTIANDACSRPTSWLYLDCSREGASDPDLAAISKRGHKLGEGEWAALLALEQAICDYDARSDDAHPLDEEPARQWLPDSIPIHGIRMHRRADVRELFATDKANPGHEDVRSRIRRIASAAPQHGANPDLMQALRLRLKRVTPPSGT